jgi:integrase
MARLQLKNVHQKADGRLYYRRKVAGKDTYTRLPDADDPTFSERYQRAAQTVERDRPMEGSLAALVASYRASSEFRDRAAKTVTNDSRYLDMVVAAHGHRSVVGVTPQRVRQMRDVYQDRAGTAHNWLRVFRALLQFAAENGWRNDNPARGVKPPKLGEHQPWPSHVLERSLGAASPMTRLAIVVGLCTGCRIGDAIQLQHRWMQGQLLEYTATKNTADVAVPKHPLLLAEIAKLPKRAVTILYDRSGRPFQSTGTLQSRIRDLMVAIGEEGYSFHGLRKNACCYLAELGLSDTEIGALVGMTAGTVRHYTKRKRAYMIALNVAQRVTSGDVLQLRSKG